MAEPDTPLACQPRVETVSLYRRVVNTLRTRSPTESVHILDELSGRCHDAEVNAHSLRSYAALVGPAGTSKSHVLVALGHAAVEAGHRVRYFSAAELVDTLYRGLADNSVGRVIEGVFRADFVLVDLCRHRDYPDTRRERRAAGGERLGLVGIVPVA